MYADFSFYQSHYYNSITTEADFNRLATRASDYIDYLTAGKAAGYTAETAPAAGLDALKKCCCELADQFQVIENANDYARSGDGKIASETVGSHSRSFRSGADIVTEQQEQLRRIARQYLSRTGLLYGGIPCIPLTL